MPRLTACRPCADRQVREDYAAFDVTVTTDASVYSSWTNYRVRVALISSATTERYGSAGCGMAQVSSYQVGASCLVDVGPSHLSRPPPCRPTDEACLPARAAAPVLLVVADQQQPMLRQLRVRHGTGRLPRGRSVGRLLRFASGLPSTSNWADRRAYL